MCLSERPELIAQKIDGQGKDYRENLADFRRQFHVEHEPSQRGGIYGQCHDIDGHKLRKLSSFQVPVGFEGPQSIQRVAIN